MAAAVTIVLSLAPDSSARDPVRTFAEDDPVVGVQLTLDTLDATRGLLRVRVSVVSEAEALPPEGATLFTDLPGLTSVMLPVDRVAADRSSEVLVEGNDIAAYPYDVYHHTFQFLLVPGHISAVPSAPPERTLPLHLEVVDALAGFAADASWQKAPTGVLDVDVQLPRQLPAVIWATAMIGIYWLLAISAFAVVLATALGLRTFETRHLAWLGAMIFAFAAFRGTAPGSPPIGVFLDYGSFFWAEAIVSLSLVVLVSYYLTGDRGEPTPPPAPAGAAAPAAPAVAATDGAVSQVGMSEGAKPEGATAGAGSSDAPAQEATLGAGTSDAAAQPRDATRAESGRAGQARGAQERGEKERGEKERGE